MAEEVEAEIEVVGEAEVGLENTRGTRTRTEEKNPQSDEQNEIYITSL